MTMEQRPTVLIIEDDPDTSEAMKVTLEAQGYEVDTAFDPDEGMAKAQALGPSLIILDVMFGRREQTKGFEYAVKFRQDKGLAATPILMITAVNIRHPGFKFSPESDAEYLPVDDFIDKPAQPKELVEKVRRLVALKQSPWRDWPRKRQ